MRLVYAPSEDYGFDRGDGLLKSALMTPILKDVFAHDICLALHQ